ncbi:MAG: hypothetical protein ACYDHY_07880 [Acidiferrobacterales bacterium]
MQSKELTRTDEVRLSAEDLLVVVAALNVARDVYEQNARAMGGMIGTEAYQAAARKQSAVCSAVLERLRPPTPVTFSR